MPVMNGFDMVRRIRETDKTTPIIFGSALTSPRDVKEGYKLGVNNYVKKPFVPDELDAHVHALLKLTEGHKTTDETGHFRLGRYTLDAPHAILRDDQTEELQTLANPEPARGPVAATPGRKPQPDRAPRSHPQPPVGHGGERLLRLAQPGRVCQQAAQAAGRRAAGGDKDRARRGTDVNG